MLSKAVSAIVRVSGALMSVILTLIVSRSYSVDTAANFFYFFNVSVILSVFILFGINTYIVREVSKFNDKDSIPKGVVGEIRFAYLLAVLLTFILFFGGFVYIRVQESLIDLSELLYILLISMSLCVLNISSSIHQGRQRLNQATIYLNLLPSFLFVIFFGGGLVFSIILNPLKLLSITYLFSCVVSIFSVRRDVFFDFKIKKIEMKKVKSFYLTQVVQLGLLSFIPVICKSYYNSNDIGNFYVAIRVTAVLSLFFVVLNFIIMPRISSIYHNSGLDALGLYCKKITRLTIFVSLPVFFLILFFSDNISLMFGSEYVGSSNIVLILAFGFMSAVLFGQVGSILNMTGLEGDFSKINILSLIVSLSLTYIVCEAGLPIYYPAIVYAFVMFIQNLLGFLVIKRKLGFYTL
ncbi:hypothetical protein MRN67_14485 [bacterium 19CA01SA08]|uniref:Polysaccharide biosynthesis protein C-terminal domain-containing protein n=1 Tax=bacterium 19CA01SA08 TaxID=2920574 RepID=A0AAU6VMU4_UNCXX